MSEQRWGPLLQDAIDHSEAKTGQELRWLHPFPKAVAMLEAKLEAMERALASNIRSRCIDMIGQGYCTPEEQAPFFPHVPAPVLASVFAEPFVAALAAAQEEKE